MFNPQIGYTGIGVYVFNSNDTTVESVLLLWNWSTSTISNLDGESWTKDMKVIKLHGYVYSVASAHL